MANVFSIIFLRRFQYSVWGFLSPFIKRTYLIKFSRVKCKKKIVSRVRLICSNSSENLRYLCVCMNLNMHGIKT